MTKQRIFGTDGVRGRFGHGWLSPEGVTRIGHAVGQVFGSKAPDAGGKRRALVGHDGRRSGPELEAAIASGLAAAGFETISVGLIPTPGLALLTRLQDFDLGVMISASHNPAHDNGVKVFGGDGDKLSDEVELAIEALLRAAPVPIEAVATIQRPAGLEEAYLEHLLEAAGDLELNRMVIALDCANGGGSRIAPRLLCRLGAQVVAVACEPDGDNINRNCGSTHPEALCAAVRAHGCELGIALDGDGDRCLLVDETGQVVHGDAVLMLLAQHASQLGRLTDQAIVATVMSNRGLHRALRDSGTKVHTVGVGDRAVVEGLLEHGLALGGEQSGHIIFGQDNFYIGDGSYSALRVLQALVASGEPLSALAQAFQPFPQVLVNVPVSQKPPLEEVASVMASVQAIEAELGQDGRVLLRYSGTEPLARVMVEGPDKHWIQDQANALATLIGQELG